MRKLVLLLASFAITAPLSVATTPADEAVPEEVRDALGLDANYIVGLYEFPRDVEPGDRWFDSTVVKVEPVLHFLVVKPDLPPLFEARLKVDDNVRYVELDLYEMSIAYTPNDPLYASNQWGPQKIGAPAAWDQTLGSTSVKICITDTGLRSTHQDVSGRVVGGYNFDASNTNYADGNGHGTHVATTASGITNNGLGIAGVGQASILVAKVLNDQGSGTFSAIAQGIRWCADQGAKVISSSLGGSSGTTALADAVTYAWGKGAVLVAAAGNSGPCSNCVGYPARYTNEIAVSCTTSSNALCSFSSTGPEVDLAAPGNNIIAGWHTSNTATNTISGTSMSTPHVAGAAVLLFAKNPTWTNSQVRSALESNAQDLGSAGWDQNFGYGLVRPDLAMGGGSPPPSCSGGPANNCFATATATSTSPYSATPSTSGATTESGEPAPCGSMGATIWYSWTAPASGTATVSTNSASTNYDTVLAAYTGTSLSALSNLACNDDFSGTKSQITFSCTAGTTYKIQLGGYQGAQGTAGFSISGCASGSSGPALNENFDDGAANGWTLSGLWRITNGCVTAASAPNSLQYNQASSCTYSTGARTTGNADTPAMNIGSISAPTLTFSTRYAKELYADGAYDVMKVQVQVSGSTTWTTLWQRDSRDNDQTSWTSVSLSLSSYKSSATKVRFAFDSVDGSFNSYNGWALDNVVVQ